MTAPPALSEKENKILRSQEESLRQLREAELDNGPAYILNTMDVVSTSITTAQDRPQQNHTFSEQVFASGQNALQLAGERFLHLADGLPAPRNVFASTARFHGFSDETILDDDDEYKTSRRQVIRGNINMTYSIPTSGDRDQYRLTCAAGALMCTGGCLLASKNLVAEGKMELDEAEREWREELLWYAVLAIVGLAKSLSDGYGGKQVIVWDQAVCGASRREAAT